MKTTWANESILKHMKKQTLDECYYAKEQVIDRPLMTTKIDNVNRNVVALKPLINKQKACNARPSVIPTKAND
jgi:hypothetical protein